jgi:hypothetical protein
MKKINLILIILLSCIYTLSAGVGSDGYDFMKINPYASSSALGDSDMATQDPTTALNVNPANLAYNQNWFASLNNMEWIPFYRLMNFSGGIKLGPGTLGSEVRYFMLTESDSYDSAGSFLGQKSDYMAYNVSLGYGMEILADKMLSAGIQA